MPCRICGAPTRTVLDLGEMPPANRLPAGGESETAYRLDLEFCDACANLQLGTCVEESELYDDYLYVTPESPSLSAHYEALITRMETQGWLGPEAFLFEFGGNIGRFLAHAKPRVARVHGLDPAREIAEMATADGVPTTCGYFSPETADNMRAEHGPVDVIAARHCAAHNADAHALVEGARRLLKPSGVFVMENAYGLDTVLNREIGQIYHEHMFYFMAKPVRRLFEAHGLDLIDLVYAADIHGGSMAFFGAAAGAHPVAPIVGETIAREEAALGGGALEALPAFVEGWRRDVRALLDQLAAKGRTVALYGASAKAATFVNVTGIGPSDVLFCADSTPRKIGRRMPGSGVPIVSEADAIAAAPDYFMVTAWNYRDELIAKVRAEGNRHSGFATPFPRVEIVAPCALDA
jgi:SAM-dependent methyltransferase